MICLAFATWCFINTWVEYAEGGIAYFARQDPVRAVVVPVICLTTILTFIMVGLWEFCRRRRLDHAIPLHLLFLASCLAPFGIASVAALRVLPLTMTEIVRKPLFWPLALTVAIVPLGLACARPRRASRVVCDALLCSWPLLLVVLVQAYRGSLFYPHSAYADGAPAAPLGSRSKHVRVVWIIFDELSQSIAFGNRPARLALPNLDGLKESAFFASSAESPANLTEFSLPSLILGELVTGANPLGPDTLRVTTASHPKPVAFQSIPNLFDAARFLGFNTALVGWYHPYGRVLSHSLTKCYWTPEWLPVGTEERTYPQRLVDAMLDRLRLQFVALPLVGHLPGVFPGYYQRYEKIEQFSWLRDRAIESVEDPSIGLALIHLPIPHPVGIFSRTSGSLTTDRHAGYLDNVALVDRTLGELQKAMARSGLWDRTAVLVTADHGWRPYIWRDHAEWTSEEEAREVKILERAETMSDGLPAPNDLWEDVTHHFWTM